MEFIWGVDKEAEIYCTSVKVSIKNQQGEELENVLNDISTQMLLDNWEDAPRMKVIHSIVSFVENDVKAEGWSLNDEDGVAWFMGLYCKSFIRSLRRRQESFDDLFKQCFKEYFKKR